MYNFRDVIETSEGLSLPSEALKINGEYIENLITGYRTLSVVGREALSPEVETYETGNRDGSTLKGKRYPARTIRITYQIIAASNEEFRSAYNKLASILDVTDAELIFDDEPDKFFIGTPVFIGEVTPGRNSVVGEFEILCLDPFKYSVMEYEAAPVEGEASILVDYNGTYKSFPTLQAEFYNEDETSEDGESVTALTGAGDCGYVAFFNESEKIIQIGDPDEVDNESLPKAQTLFNHQFNTEKSWGTAAKKLWVVNSGITSSSAVEQAGTPGMAVATYTTPTPLDKKIQELLTVTSKADRPYIHYTVSARASSRTASSVTLQIIVVVRLDNSESYFGRGYGLQASVYIGGRWNNVQLKNADEFWRGTSYHKRTLKVTLSDLEDKETTLSGIKFKVSRTDSTVGTAGTLNETACNSFTISAYDTPKPSEYYIKAADYGSGDNWHGPSITRTIPADASGVVGAPNFTLTYAQKMSIGSATDDVNQLGAFQVLLVSGSGTSRKIVAGVNVYKGSAGKKAKLRFYINNTVPETTEIDLSYNNKYFKSSQTSTITKSGQTVTFNICGIKRTFKAEAIAETAVNEVTFTFTKFGSSTALSYNGLFWAKFVKNNCNTWKDVPNKFSANDVVEADCQTGEILLNGVPSDSYGALGNDWEEFYLTPGLNQIGFSYSEWVKAGYAPKFKVKYREVFL